MSREPKAPFIRLHERGESPHLDMLIALLPLIVLSAVNYGWRPVLVVLSGIFGAAVMELAGCLLMKRRPTLLDGNALYIGAAIGALMSPVTSYWVPMLGAAFAIAVVKLPFGGTGRYVFQPVAAGMALISQCIAGTVFVYPAVGAVLPLGITKDYVAVTSPAAQLAASGTPTVGVADILLGNFPGPIGATAVALLLACLLYLLLRRAVSGWSVIPYLLVCAAAFCLFSRTGAPSLHTAALEMSSGYLLFAGIFLLGDLTTTPGGRVARVVFGVLAGLLTVVLRFFGRFEDSTAFAILLISPLAPIIDRLCWIVGRAGKKEGER